MKSKSWGGEKPAGSAELHNEDRQIDHSGSAVWARMCVKSHRHTLGTNVDSGASIFLLYISAHISYPPSIHRFLLKKKCQLGKSNFKNAKKNSPQRSGSLDDDLFLGVSKSADQRADDVFSLQETPCRRIVINQV